PAALLLRLPPPTPSPYTTLFRSSIRRRRRGRRRRLARRVGTCGRGVARVRPPHRVASHDRLSRREGRGALREADAYAIGETREEDRKSTRLNSSHQIISYAVFCL